MLFIVIAVLAVLVIMNIFMLLILKQMLGQTGKQIEKDAGRLFAVYDALLEKKSRRLEELKAEEENLLLETGKKREALKRMAAEQARPVPPQRETVAADYRDAGFAETYKRIKEEFSFSAEALYASLQARLPKQSAEEQAALKVVRELKEGLSFESRYRLSLLSVPQQTAVLEEVLSGDALAYYRDWWNAHPEGDIVAFYDHLESELQRLDDRLVMRTAEEDAGICEGAVFRCGNRLYDYSI